MQTSRHRYRVNSCHRPPVDRDLLYVSIDIWTRFALTTILARLIFNRPIHFQQPQTKCPVLNEILCILPLAESTIEDLRKARRFHWQQRLIDLWGLVRLRFITDWTSRYRSRSAHMKQRPLPESCRGRGLSEDHSMPFWADRWNVHAFETMGNYLELYPQCIRVSPNK